MRDPWLQGSWGQHMGPIWGRQDPGGPNVGPMNFAIWDVTAHLCTKVKSGETTIEVGVTE